MEPIRSGLRSIMRDLMKAQPPEEVVVLAWPLVCGKDVAARTRAAAFAEGRLTVEVSDPAWRTQLISFAPRYVGVFAELLGPVVKEVRFEAKQSALSNQHSAKRNT
jgi:predicted nucleic acid-binding Zn ribbon protein